MGFKFLKQGAMGSIPNTKPAGLTIPVGANNINDVILNISPDGVATFTGDGEMVPFPEETYGFNLSMLNELLISEGFEPMKYIFVNTTNTTDLTNYFSAIQTIEEINVLPESVVNMNYMASNCLALKKAYLPPNVENAVEAYGKCDNLIEVKGLDTLTKVKDFTDTFAYCKSLVLDDVNVVLPFGYNNTKYYGTFRGCPLLSPKSILFTNIPTTNANTITMEYMFSGSGIYETFDLSILSYISNYSGIFSSCERLTRAWSSTDNVLELRSKSSLMYMFRNCTALESICGLFDYQNTYNRSISYFLDGCTALRFIGTESEPKVIDFGAAYKANSNYNYFLRNVSNIKKGAVSIGTTTQPNTTCISNLCMNAPSEFILRVPASTEARWKAIATTNNVITWETI